MLKKYTKAQENRIVRSVALACTKDINLLNKHGYRWLHIKSGFIAHYNLGGFIGHYGHACMLKQDVLAHQQDNQHGNWHRGEDDYEYYMQQRDMYNRVCDIIRHRRKVPAESGCFRAPSLKEELEAYKRKGLCTDKSIQACIDKYMRVFSCGTFYCGDYEARARDLAYITELYNCLEAEGSADDETFYRKEYTYPSGNTGTFNEIMRHYGDHMYEEFAELTGQLEEAY